MKVVILTGVDGDIGFATAVRLAKEGYKIIAFTYTDRKDADLKKMSVQYNIEEFRVDLVNVEEVKKAFSLLSKYKEIYSLINIAGIYPIVPFEEYELNLWNRVLMINLTGPFLCTKYVLPFMKKNGGRIINISSTGAHLGSRDTGYSSSKAGLLGLTKSLARSLAKYNINVNAIAPGAIDTQMSRQKSIEELMDYNEKILLKRLGTPNDVSGVISFLLSDDAKYITGSTIDVNGGLYIR